MRPNNARRKPVRGACRQSALSLALWLVVGVSFLFAAPDQGADQIFFSKSFPGSKPEYFEIAVHSTGRASYREDPADENPLQFTLSDEETRKVFELGDRLDRFRRALQSDRKIAFTGKKALRYTNAAGEQTSVEFTYSTDKDAQAIVEWFESAAETERHRIELDRVVQFDRLGVNKALLLFQVSFDNGRVVAAQQFVPILKTIAEDSKFMHMARARAASLLERIGNRDP